jgi:hypothetical protein
VRRLLIVGVVAVFFASATSAHASAFAHASSSASPGSLPRSATYCATQVKPTPEVVAANTTANHTVGDGSYAWGTEIDPSYWTKWGAYLAEVQGAYIGTTDEIIQWTACRWGWGANLLRAVAVQETDWRQGFVGNGCGEVGEASYGIIQVKNAYCNGALAWGGYPDTQRSTALALDFYGAYMHACYTNAFYDGGSWLYHGRTVSQIAAARGWPYVRWGCIGSWYSGGWYDPGASAYIKSVKAHLAAKNWP